MPDTDQAARENMEQEAAKELVGRNGHDLLLAAMGVITPEEGHISIAEVDEARVGDGYAGVYRARYFRTCSGPPNGGLA
jgi:hypothetical protein